jgi:hypothetical protein
MSAKLAVTVAQPPTTLAVTDTAPVGSTTVALTVTEGGSELMMFWTVA